MSNTATTTIPLDEPFAREVLAYALVVRAARIIEEGEVWIPAALLALHGIVMVESEALDVMEEIGRLGESLRALLNTEGPQEIAPPQGLAPGAAEMVVALRERVREAESDQERAQLAAAIIPVREFVERYFPADEAVA